MEKTIFHIDVNSAFLSWSAVKRLKDDPAAQDIRLIPSIVGGDVKTRHGIVTAKSIPAKKYGIKTGEPVVKALQKCPELVIVRSDFDTYREYSAAFIAILRKYSPKVEQASIDEAFLDMTEVLADFPDTRPMAQKTAGQIREEISRTLGFTVNVGISTNKLLAKMASDFAKPDRTHTLYPEEIPEKMWPLPIGDLYGCGAKTADKLRTLGVLTIGDAAALPEDVLRSYLGEKAGEYISLSSKGIGSDAVHTDRDDAKSYSNEVTTPYDITDENYDDEMPPLLLKLCEKVSGRMKRDGVYAGTLSVIVKTDDFHRRSMQQKLTDASNDPDIFYAAALALMEKLLRGEDGLFAAGTGGVRLVGIGASDLDKGAYRQLTLTDIINKAEGLKTAEAGRPDETCPDEEADASGEPDDQRTRTLAEMLQGLQERFGSKIVQKGPENLLH